MTKKSQKAIYLKADIEKDKDQRKEEILNEKFGKLKKADKQVQNQREKKILIVKDEQEHRKRRVRTNKSTIRRDINRENIKRYKQVESKNKKVS